MKRLLSFISVFIVVAGFISFDSAALETYDLSAECAALMCVQTGELLLSKNADQKRSMASTTKIMTSLLAIEQYTPWREIKVASSMLNVEGTSMGLSDGDTVTLEGLVYGMLLQSGNDAANVTALALGGSIENFASLMNKRAKEIGMNNTNFVTPSGLDAQGHYSTAYDMALLGCEAVKNTVFLSVCSQKSAVIKYGNPPYPRTLTNHNKLLSDYDGAIGIKTGFTQKSGRCLVSCASREGVTLVAVTLNAPDDWQDHKKLLDYGFSVVKSTDAVFNTNNVNINVVGGESDSVSAVCHGGKIVGSTDSVRCVFMSPEFIYAPVTKGEIIGRVQWIRGDKVIASSPVTAGEDVKLKQNKPIIQKQSLFTKIKLYIKEKFQ